MRADVVETRVASSPGDPEARPFSERAHTPRCPEAGLSFPRRAHFLRGGGAPLEPALLLDHGLHRRRAVRFNLLLHRLQPHFQKLS